MIYQKVTISIEFTPDDFASPAPGRPSLRSYVWQFPATEDNAARIAQLLRWREEDCGAPGMMGVG